MPADSTIFLSDFLSLGTGVLNHFRCPEENPELFFYTEQTSVLPEETISEKQHVLNGMFILFLFCMIMTSRIFNNNGKFLTSMFTELFRLKKRNSIFSEVVGSEFYHKIQLCLQTVVILSIFAYKVFFVESQGADIISLRNSFLIIGFCCLFLILFLLYKWLSYFVMGKIFFNEETYSQWMSNFTSLIGILGIIIFIPVLLMFYIDSIHFFCYFFVIFCLLWVVIFMIYKTYVLFFHNVGLLLYLFLYLCAQEIAPLLILHRGLLYLFNVVENNILWRWV